MGSFELFPAKHGTGWIGIHVKVKEWLRPPGFANCNGMICLSHEAENSAELDGYIDELIAELQALKATGRRKFARMRKAG